MTNFLDVNIEYSKDKQLKKPDVLMFMDWVRKQPHLPEITELQAILFLQSCHYRNEAAKTALDTFFTVKTLCPEMFGMRKKMVSPLQETVNLSLISPLPKDTPDGFTIIFIKLIDSSLEKYIFSEQCRYFDLISMLHLYQNGTSEGHLIVFDMENITFGHLTKLGPLTIKNFLFYLQEAMPVRLKGLHFFNIVPFMDKILALMKPFMKKELMDVLFLHNCVDDLVKCVPVECLPEEYGGTAENIAVLHDKVKSNLKNNAAVFGWEDGQKVDESKRPGKPKNVGDIFGVEGTFKRLEID